MPLFDHVLHPASVDGLARLQTRLLRQYLTLTTGLYAVGVAVSILPHANRVTANISGGLFAISLGTAGLVALWVWPRTTVGHRAALGAAMAATPVVMAFHVLTAAQFLCLVAVMFLAMHIRAFHRDRSAWGLIASVVVLVVAALWWAPAPVYPITYIVFVVAITGAAESFGAVTKALITASCTDSLTGLFNRAGWEIAAAEIGTSRPAHQDGSDEDSKSLTVVAADVDDFKSVNDNGGHQAGDALLIEFASSWLRLAPRGTVIARLGGDEFAALLAGHSAAAVDAFVLATGEQLPYVSVGVAISLNGDESVADVLARADANLYRVKRASRRRPHT